MNFGLAREIYGLNAWSVDPITFQSLMSTLKNVQNGVTLEIPDVKYNSISFYNVKSKETRLVTETWQLSNDNDFEGIGVINLNGPITKGGGASSYGTKDLSSQMLSMANDNRIKGFILKVDSGGGASNAVSILSDTINEIKQTKPVYTLVEKGGIMASAAYGIGSAGNKIFAEDNMSTIGSVGTMISFEGKKSFHEDRDGYKNIVLYATKSTEKNKAFNEALDNDNYELLVNELLDPINENFIAMVESNRSQLKGTDFDNGHTVFSKDAIGTFIDGIASFNEVVEMVLEDSKNNSSSNLSLINSQKKMTKEELKQSHPEVYSSVVSEGANAERERVASWMVYANTDLEAVTQGIKGGAEISASQREEFMVKMNSAEMIKKLQSDSQDAVVVAEAPVNEGGNPKNEELENAFGFKL
jgi:ClpP class serine protease